MFHPGSPGAQFEPDAGDGRVGGRAPDGQSYSSFATFSDPDGNSWLLQEVTTRLPGRVDAAATSYASRGGPGGRDAARRRPRTASTRSASAQADANWPDWYAAYMVAEQAGTELPT